MSDGEGRMGEKDCRTRGGWIREAGGEGMEEEVGMK